MNNDPIKTMKSTDRFLVFDCEAKGLFGETFAYGAVIIENLKEIRAELIYCPAEEAYGPEDGRQWVIDNVPPLEKTHDNFDNKLLHMKCRKTQEVRDHFSRLVEDEIGNKARFIVDCGWPVEAGFMIQIAREQGWKYGDGPYPLHELASIRESAGLCGTETCERFKENGELPAHDPLCDARQSARKLIEALKELENMREESYRYNNLKT